MDEGAPENPQDEREVPPHFAMRLLDVVVFSGLVATCVMVLAGWVTGGL